MRGRSNKRPPSSFSLRPPSSFSHEKGADSCCEPYFKTSFHLARRKRARERRKRGGEEREKKRRERGSFFFFSQSLSLLFQFHTLRGSLLL